MNINEELINEAIEYIMPVRDVFAKGSRLAKEKLRKQEQQKRRQQKHIMLVVGGICAFSIYQYLTTRSNGGSTRSKTKT